MTGCSSKLDQDLPIYTSKEEPSFLHHILVFKRPILRLLDGLVYFGPTFAHNRFLVVGDSPVPGGRERLDQLACDCRMSLDYLQGYFTPESLNRIPIL